MTPSQVAALVNASIGDRWSQTNLHRVNLREQVLETPLQIDATDVVTEQTVTVWLVLTECGVGKNGYAVGYSESDRAFGLLQFASGYGPSWLGIYGTFWEAFEGM